MKHSVYAVAFTYYIETGRIISKEMVINVLGRTYGALTSVNTLPPNQMCLTTEEYLHGLISVVNELPRLSIHVVTLGDYDAPIRIASLVKQVHAAFQILNLKNDLLRKRFDTLKYDVKRVEEVVYDIRLRGLGPTESLPGVAAYISDADAERVYARLAAHPIQDLENETHTTQTMGMSTS